MRVEIGRAVEAVAVVEVAIDHEHAVLAEGGKRLLAQVVRTRHQRGLGVGLAGIRRERASRPERSALT